MKPIVMMLLFAGTIGGVFIGINELMSSQYSMKPAEVTEKRLIQIEQSLRMYRFDFNRYPNTEEGLGALLFNPETGEPWEVPYIDGKNLKDEWGEDFDFDSSGKEVQLTSKGPDQATGTYDDIKKTIR